MTSLVLLVRWLLRSVARHSCRVVILLDAKAVLGAASKGRSSSPPFLRGCGRLASLVLAGDLLLRLVYVPSEDMPADAPSRGRRLRGRAIRSANAAARRHGLRVDAHLARSADPVPSAFSLSSYYSLKIPRGMKRLGIQTKRFCLRDY